MRERLIIAVFSCAWWTYLER